MTAAAAQERPKKSHLSLGSAPHLYVAFAAVVFAQLVFWNSSRNTFPDMAIVPDVPGREVVKALSLGDEQFYFRVLALEIQNAGDTYGRFTPLKNYDYDKLSQWFFLLDTLDPRSDYIPSLATYYYAQTQNVPDVRYIVDYLYEHGKRDVTHKWWWLLQGMYLANHKLEDKDLALKVGTPMIDAEGIPLWARQFPAFIYEQKGEREQALYVMEHVLESAGKDKLTREEFNFMKYFIEERIEKEMPGLMKRMAPALDENGMAIDEPAAGQGSPVTTP